MNNEKTNNNKFPAANEFGSKITNGAGKIYYTFTDNLGSLNMIVNTDGTIASDMSYDAWGRRRNPTDWTFDNVPASQTITLGFTGQEHLDCFGLINMNGRAYDPLLGQFLSPDPFVQDPTNTQSFNRYSYCFNNPLKYTDPSGFLTWAEEQARNYAWGASYTQLDGEFYSTYQLQDKSLEYSKYMGGLGYWTPESWFDYGHTTFKTNNIEIKGDIPTFNTALNWTPLDAASFNDIYRGSSNNQNNKSNQLSEGIKTKDVFGKIFTVEGAYSTLIHNNTTYKTTKGIIKNIFKANGEVTSARALRFANMSRAFRFMGEIGGAFNTGMAYYDIANGQQQPITYVDAGVGTIGIITTSASYFYGMQIPIVGEFVAVYGISRLTWDVFYNLGEKYGFSTWYGNDNTKWFK